MTYTDVMVDLETLGTAPGSVILSIGAVAFNEAQPEAEWKLFNSGAISVMDSRTYELTIDEGTLAWWLKQDLVARQVLDDALNGNASVLLHAALRDFTAWYPSGTRLWGNGANFDNVLLRSAYSAMGGTAAPWPYYDDRCYRTLKAAFKQFVPELMFQGTRHDALADALHQTRYLQAIWVYKRWAQSAYEAGMRGDL
jgi:3'-5' exoribonuclease-like protein